jgi:hypothetical protein
MMATPNRMMLTEPISISLISQCIAAV